MKLKFLLQVLLLPLIYGWMLSACKLDGELVFKEGFEYYELNQTPDGPWTIEGAGTAVIDSTRSHSGKYAVYLESGEGFDNRAYLRLTGNPLFPFKYNRITGSYYLWMDTPPPNDIPWTIIEASGPVRDQEYSSQFRFGGKHLKMLLAAYDTEGKNTNCWQYSSATLPLREWVKIGWQFDGSTQRVQFWINDELIEDLSVTQKGAECMGNDLDGEWVFPVFTDLFFGWADLEKGGGKRRFWIDDVMLYQ